jgi:nucleoside-triphosphatase
MARFLLFTGEKAVGKTTALRRVVDQVGIDHFTGFFADELRCDGQRSGFDVVLLDGRRGSLASVDSTSDIRVGGLNAAGVPRYGVELGFLDDVALPMLAGEADSRPPRVLVVDEIGPMQLHSTAFQRVIADLASLEDVTLLGTIVLRSLPWTDELKARTNVETFLVTHHNRDTMATMMTMYVQHLMDG